ncbi:hypothetical protein [Roseobacter denitrificans]|uniref:hypothetical protein n=1 Tax=Roseobacter denitrificans TaxID=2434 RepID=UPI0008EB76C2|nr:hypothetical protein [Roseobacter denitrificans]SFF83835.1 hypothetical protein SAMN05443635_102541 [Roseobacter denitrificans OCh 114]
MEYTPHPIEVSTVLRRLCNHLDFLAARVFEVEEELGNMLIDKENSEGVSITRIQSLDFTRQSLEDCAILLQLLAQQTTHAPIQISNDAVASTNLKLSSTKSILGTSRKATEIDTSGNVDIF